ncbi:MAG: hypothetical protein GC160_07595 [Acidobacteria bacterium]|nr:hypothetical protein [Acidobacteriota bacterium]
MRALSRRDLFSTLGACGLAALPACTAGHAEKVKITRVDLHKVVVPMQDDIISSPELGPDALTEFPSIPKFILELHTDSGIVGVGETPRAVEESDVLPNAQFLEGKNLFDLNLARLELPNRRTYSAFEIAVFDALGKAVGWPVYQLLGGKAQDKVYVTYWCGRKNPVDARRVAQRALDGGFTNLKMKGRPGDPIVEAVAAVGEVAPNLKVTVDFNSHYATAEEFLPIGKGLDVLDNMLTIEDPVKKDDLSQFARLEELLRTPITLTAGNARLIVEGAKAGACTYINTGPAPGMHGFVRNAYVAGGAGMPVWHGSGHELGIKDAAFIHSCAAAENCTLASDALSYRRVDDLLVEAIPIVESYAIVPDRPGLGVELDRDAVARYGV